MNKLPPHEPPPAWDSYGIRLNCPHCSYETNDQAAYEAHLTRHSQVNPSPTPPPGPTMTADELASLLVRQFRVYMEHTTWPNNDEELERLAQHLARNLLMAHEVILKRVAAYIRKTHQQRRET